MRKSMVIAHCLVNSRMVEPLADAERAVENVFRMEFPDENFHEWNQNAHESVAENIIQAVGRASRINVKKFIEDLW